MALYDQGGGCACGLYAVCDCEEKEKKMPIGEHDPYRQLQTVYPVEYWYNGYAFNPAYPYQPLPIGCICPGDATPYCKNPMCPRRNPFDTASKTC